jgi:hypothetical protein
VTTASSPPGRALRIGVTGTRKLASDQNERLNEQVTRLLRAIASQAKANGVNRLELLSPLAEGADRLVADRAVDAGFTLVCPLPFPQQVYEEDFKDLASIAEFRDRLGRAAGRVLVLDGKRGDDEARSYEAVGRMIVRNCDLLIAIWDGRPGEGRGGTADTVHYAANFGPPVVWFHATDPKTEPNWIEEVHDLRDRSPLSVYDRLERYLQNLLAMPTPHVHPDHQSLVHAGCYHLSARIGAVVRSLLRRPKPTPLTIFLAERPHPVCGPWKLADWFTKVMIWCALSPPRYAGRADTAPAPRQAEAQHWHAHYNDPDARASEYVARYRSSYVWTFLLAAIALSAAAVALAYPEPIIVKIIATGVELTTLLLILLLVVLNSVFGWQTRAIEYRLVAELCRKQQALAPLAWVVPRATAWATSDDPEVKREKDKPSIEPIPWVSWVFGAWLRDAPLPTGTIDAAWVSATRDAAIHDLIDEQIEYHDKRCIRSYRAGRRLVRLGELFFAVVLGLVAVKFYWLSTNTLEQDLAMHPTLTGFGLAGAILPALSAAFVGIRAYAELEILAEQSAAMLTVMRDAKKQISALDPGAPLASQTLGVALAAVATVMLEDLEGWARLFRGKVLDA